MQAKLPSCHRRTSHSATSLPHDDAAPRPATQRRRDPPADLGHHPLPMCPPHRHPPPPPPPQPGHRRPPTRLPHPPRAPTHHRGLTGARRLLQPQPVEDRTRPRQATGRPPLHRVWCDRCTARRRPHPPLETTTRSRVRARQPANPLSSMPQPSNPRQTETTQLETSRSDARDQAEATQLAAMVTRFL
jgi:hypothetical protein